MIATSTRPMIHVPTALADADLGRICRAYANEVKYECLRMLRAPAFSIPFLLLPVPVYLFFGVMLAAGSREEPGRCELPVLRILGLRGHGPGVVRRRLRIGGGARGRTAQAEAGAPGAGRGLSHRQDDDGRAVRRASDDRARRRGACGGKDQPHGLAAADHDHGHDDWRDSVRRDRPVHRRPRVRDRRRPRSRT